MRWSLVVVYAGQSTQMMMGTVIAVQTIPMLVWRRSLVARTKSALQPESAMDGRDAAHLPRLLPGPALRHHVLGLV